MITFFISAFKIIVLLGFLVWIHEGGHFLVAKLFRIRVNEFALGFGPTIYTKEKGETKYALRLIPLGGFVSLEGEEERSNAKDSFSQASIPKRMAVVSAGGLVNIIFGLLLYFVLACILLKGFHSGWMQTKYFLVSILQGLKQLLTGVWKIEQLTGIVGISDMVAHTQGVNQYFYIMAVISVSLGITNLLPFPPLDGGKILLYLIEAIRHKPLRQEIELKIQSIGFSLLIVLAIYVTYHDIIKIF